MKNLIKIIVFLISFGLPLLQAAADEQETVKELVNSCRKDLEFFRSSMQKNSAPFANKVDKKFHDWYKKGYENTLKLVDSIGDKDDCFYALKYYINGFDLPHISIRSYISLPAEEYPGILSAKQGDEHKIIYKNEALKYLEGVSVGDKVTHVNDIKIEDFHKSYIIPFYANNKSKLAEQSASIYTMILDGNRFKPIARSVTVEHDGQPIKVDLKYTELKGSALAAAKQVRQPKMAESFKIEMASGGAWIKIPSFFPNNQEIVYYTGMLSTLKKQLAKEDYILFDLRGNRGGASKWSRPIIRNLWGDDYIKSLGDKHIYNKTWHKNLRVSKENFTGIKPGYAQSVIKAYGTAMRKGESFFQKKWSIYSDKDNLYTNGDSAPFNAKVYVLTDHFCRSTCWAFVNELRQIPGVMHLGDETTMQSVYSFARQMRAPSEDFDFFYPTEMWIYPEYKPDQVLIPSKIYKGDWSEESQVIDWVLSVIEKN